MSKQEFMVFVDCSDGWTGYVCSSNMAKENPSLADVIEHAAGPAWGETFTPVAWVAGHSLDVDAGRAASIAAGRLIEKTASGWVALGAEKQEEKPASEWDAEDNHKRNDEAWREWERVKAEIEADNAAMIARDLTGAENKVFRKALVKSATVVHQGELATSAKPNPFPSTLRSPDCESGPSDHLNASRHQMAGMKG